MSPGSVLQFQWLLKPSTGISNERMMGGPGYHHFFSTSNQLFGPQTKRRHFWKTKSFEQRLMLAFRLVWCRPVAHWNIKFIKCLSGGWTNPTWNICASQIGSFPQVGVKIKKYWNHHLVVNCRWVCYWSKGHVPTIHFTLPEYTENTWLCPHAFCES